MSIVQLQLLFTKKLTKTPIVSINFKFGLKLSVCKFDSKNGREVFKMKLFSLYSITFFQADI